MTSRRVLTGLLSTSIVATIILALIALFQGALQFVGIDMLGAGLIACLLVAHLRGWRYAAHIFTGLIALLTVAGAPATAAEGTVLSYALIGPAVIAAVLLPWQWSLGAFAVAMIGVGLRWGWQGPVFSPVVLTILVSQAIGISLASLVARTAQRTAETNAARADEARTRSEAQAHELERKAGELSEQNEQQRRLLALVATLETPAVALADGVLLAPVVGHLDSRRAQALTSRLLNKVSTERTRLVVLDIAGVSTVDTEVAQSLLRAVQALRLLGCSVTITGISAAVAATITALGVNMRGIDTARTPQEALERAAAVGRGLPVAANGKQRS